MVALGVVLASGNVTRCTQQSNVCNRYTPCCNSEGWCGKGFAYCGQTCHEAGNFGDVKCFPKAPCRSEEYTFHKSRILGNEDYGKIGDFKSYDFKITGDYAIEDGEVILKMSQPNSGATLQSTRYVDYGKITAVMKTSRGAGVISSFITMSDTKDEIDFEWVGKNTKEVQTNWFQDGHFPTWPETHGQTHPQPDSFNGYNEYTIDWNPERIIWYVNGKPVREYSGQEYPNTPSLYSFGIWDGGSNSEGTRNWAGGYVDWNSTDMKNPGYYSVRVKSVKVECHSKSKVKDEDFEHVPNIGLVPKSDLAMYHPPSNQSPVPKNGLVPKKNPAMYHPPSNQSPVPKNGLVPKKNPAMYHPPSNQSPVPKNGLVPKKNPAMYHPPSNQSPVPKNGLGPKKNPAIYRPPPNPSPVPKNGLMSKRNSTMYYPIPNPSPKLRCRNRALPSSIKA
ncbi:putative glycosidase CRH2 [Massospora cicadina]|nr:putative glycosidase CRH2 [Massospora cicadina]